jgi:Protein of unknown function (DUF3574)
VIPTVLNQVHRAHISARLKAKPAACSSANQGSTSVITKEGALSVGLAGIALSLLITVGQHALGSLPLPEVSSSCRAGATRMARLELLFGLSLADGRHVTDDEWQAFVDTEITPRFPQGHTVMSGSGQWQSSLGMVAKEPSRLLIMWYSTGGASEAAIEAIRTAYKIRFGQESVMRVDGASCVSF